MILLAFIIADVVRARRLHPALLAGGTCILATDAAANALVATAGWAGIVRALTA